MADSPGALNDVLTLFGAHSFDMTHIHSSMSKDDVGEYTFPHFFSQASCYFPLFPPHVSSCFPSFLSHSSHFSRAEAFEFEIDFKGDELDPSVSVRPPPARAFSVFFACFFLNFAGFLDRPSSTCCATRPRICEC